MRSFKRVLHMGCRTIPVLVFGLLLGSTVLFGQSTSGSITGTVKDNAGAVVPEATVTVTNPQTNFTRTAASNTAGNYNFPNLSPGLYNVRAEHEGFQTEVRNSIELQVQQTARLDFKLTVGAVTQEVTVTAGAPLLNTENATIGTVIEEKRIVLEILTGIHRAGASIVLTYHAKDVARWMKAC